MREQKRVITPGPLLDGNGTLSQRGYATEAILQYRRADIKAPPWRIKEWDFYQVMTMTHGRQQGMKHVGDRASFLFSGKEIY